MWLRVSVSGDSTPQLAHVFFALPALASRVATTGNSRHFGWAERRSANLAEGQQPRVLTGHIDFIQVRNGAVHILDYKPDARTNKPIAQLTLYALALTRLANLRLFDIKCSWFNEEQYCEFFPRSLIARQ